MSDAALVRSYGRVFNEIPLEYDRHRPTYPDALVEQACATAGLADGDPVLEVGCGTGQLTRSLLSRGLHLSAIDPGDRLLRLAEQNLRGAGAVDFQNTRLEQAELPRSSYRAVFSAAAIHWVDPDVGWRRIADALAPGGTLALLQHFGLREQRSAEDQDALLSTLRRNSAESAASWPAYRVLDATIAGVRHRLGNIADAWSWLGSYQLENDEAAELFEDLQFAAVPMMLEHSAEELGALLATMSFWARISPEQRAGLLEDIRALEKRLGRPVRSSTLAVLLTARRSACEAGCRPIG